MIRAKAGITPRTFNVAGIDIIPAPIMLVATLNTAPDRDARDGSDAPVRSGAWTALAVGDMASYRHREREREIL